jgi:protein-S-isoprenylcysteine O-methyltransferase Ste14
LKRIVVSPRALWGGLPVDERLGLLSVLLKAFFAPLMVVWLFDHTALMLEHGGELAAQWGNPEEDRLSLFNSHGFWFAFKVILFLDVFFFTLGYLIELPLLKNEIRSVDPTLLGWGVALACYPPFNGMTSVIFGGGYSADFPQFGHPAVHLAANVLLLGLMAIYTSASVALNFKASNLTHRGIIARGPYRYIRHPAYVCKNLAWWIGLMPALLAATGTSLYATAMTFGSMFGWSVIYYMRALTEEDHLRSVDGEYDAYCQKVKYRFIPGVV